MSGPFGNVQRYLLRRPAAARLLVVVAIFLLWEIAARWWVDPIFLSPPSQVFTSLEIGRASCRERV